MGCSETDAGGGGGVVAVGTGVGGFGVAVGAGGWVAVGAGGCVGTNVGAWVGAVVAVGTAVGTVVGGALVAVAAGGFVAVGAVVLLAGFLVAVGSGALLLFAAPDDGFLVAVGDGSLLDASADCVAVGVGEGSSSAAESGLKSSVLLWSSGAAGGGLSSAPAVRELPLRFEIVVGASCAALPPPRRPLASRPPAIVSVPPATKAMAIVRGLISDLLVPHRCGFPGGHFRAASRGVSNRVRALP